MKLKKEFTSNMGAIQNSLNSITAAVTGAVVAGTHAADVAAQKQEKGLLAIQQYHEASADLKTLEGESAEAEKALESANEAVEATKD